MDEPFYLLYKEVLEAYPRAKFILPCLGLEGSLVSLRREEWDDWFQLLGVAFSLRAAKELVKHL